MFLGCGASTVVSRLIAIRFTLFVVARNRYVAAAPREQFKCCPAAGVNTGQLLATQLLRRVALRWGWSGLRGCRWVAVRLCRSGHRLPRFTLTLKEGLHFPEGEPSVLVSIHRLEHALVSGLKLA